MQRALDAAADSLDLKLHLGPTEPDLLCNSKYNANGLISDASQIPDILQHTVEEVDDHDFLGIKAGGKTLVFPRGDLGICKWTIGGVVQDEIMGLEMRSASASDTTQTFWQSLINNAGPTL